VAALTAKAAAAKSPTTFSARGSHARASIYSALRYSWNFGDGTGVHPGGASAKHTYAKSGKYTATVLVRDSAGCSTKQIWTGMSWFCVGDPVARKAIRVTIPAR
jgi:PKD repeat protein